MITETPPKILLAAELPEAFRQTLGTRYELVGPLDHPLENSIAALPHSVTQTIRAIVTVAGVQISPQAIEALPALGLICCRGSGYDGVDIGAARQRGVEVTYGPDLNSSSVADLAMGLLIASVRNMTTARRCIEEGMWQDDTIHRRLQVRGLTGRRLGIYGMGAIGAKIARRAEAFEMEVAYHNRRPRADARYPYFTTLLNLADWADVLMIAVRADAANRHSVNREVLTALGKGGFVVNISRGSVIDEAALLHALSAGVIAGAGLDVFEHEPSVPRELFALPRVAVTPHMGADTEEAQEAVQRLLLANLDAFFAGKPLLTPVPSD